MHVVYRYRSFHDLRCWKFFVIRYRIMKFLLMSQLGQHHVYKKNALCCFSHYFSPFAQRPDSIIWQLYSYFYLRFIWSHHLKKKRIPSLMGRNETDANYPDFSTTILESIRMRQTFFHPVNSTFSLYSYSKSHEKNDAHVVWNLSIRIIVLFKLFMFIFRLVEAIYIFYCSMCS